MALEIADGVPPDNPGTREIGFSIPVRYNASRILFDNLAKGHGDQACAHRPRRHTQLYRALRGGLPLGPWLPLARAEPR